MKTMQARWADTCVCFSRPGSVSRIHLLVACFLAAFPALSRAGENSDDRSNGTIASPMNGLYWRVDWSYMREPLRNGDYLKDVAETLSSNSCLEGVFIGFGWNDIEPRPGEYNWKFVDSVVELVRRYGKKYKLSAKAGIRTPEWVYKEGAQPFSYDKTKGARGVLKSPRPNKIPVPWDPIYLKYFTRFVERMGERYSKDVHCVAVTISGANSQSAEMHLPKEPADVAKWESLGDYKGKVVKVWQQMIDVFAAFFPKQQICLHIAMPIYGMETELKTITDYGVRKYPEQFTAQDCQLSGKSDQSQSAVYQVIREVKDKVHHGFQNVGSWTNPGPHEQGNFEMSVLNYTGVHAEYLELAYDDGMNQSLCRRFLDEVAKAREMGHEKYKASLIQSGKYVAGTGRKNKTRSMPK